MPIAGSWHGGPAGCAASVQYWTGALEHLVRASSFTDRRWGTDRQMLAGVLGRSRDPRAAEALVSQLDDDDVNAQAVGSLGKVKEPPTGARAAVEKLTDDKRAFVRRTAFGVLAKLPA